MTPPCAWREARANAPTLVKRGRVGVAPGSESRVLAPLTTPPPGASLALGLGAAVGTDGPLLLFTLRPGSRCVGRAFARRRRVGRRRRRCRGRGSRARWRGRRRGGGSLGTAPR